MCLFYFFRTFVLIVGSSFSAGHHTFSQPPIESKDAISELKSVRSSLHSAGPDERYNELRTRAQDVAVIATSTAESLSPRLHAIHKTLESIGEPTAGETIDIQEQRADFAQERDEIDSAVKRARLLATSACETLEAINRAVTDVFNRDTFERVPSPLGAANWQAVFENFQVDLGRLKSFFSDAWHHLVRAISLKLILPVATSLIFAFVLIGPLRIRLQQMGLDYAPPSLPDCRAIPLCPRKQETSTAPLPLHSKRPASAFFWIVSEALS